MKTYLLILTMAVGATVGATAPVAKACDGYGYGWSGWGAGWLYKNLQQNVPHFAAFPPVYYSYPVPRTYGYSPFAYPPGVMTPELVENVEPLEIINPHIPSSHENRAEKSKDQQAAVRANPEPLVLDNPFYVPSRTVAQSNR